MDIIQGDLFWIADDPGGGDRRPYVVVQNTLTNRSRIQTVVVCALTTQLRLSASPGNVLLDPDEGRLPRQSVVNVSQIFTVEKADLVDYIGTLAPNRVRGILRGMWQLLEPRDVP